MSDRGKATFDTMSSFALEKDEHRSPLLGKKQEPKLNAGLSIQEFDPIRTINKEVPEEIEEKSVTSSLIQGAIKKLGASGPTGRQLVNESVNIARSNASPLRKAGQAMKSGWNAASTPPKATPSIAEIGASYTPKVAKPPKSFVAPANTSVRNAPRAIVDAPTTVRSVASKVATGASSLAGRATQAMKTGVSAARSKATSLKPSFPKLDIPNTAVPNVPKLPQAVSQQKQKPLMKRVENKLLKVGAKTTAVGGTGMAVGNQWNVEKGMFPKESKKNSALDGKMNMGKDLGGKKFEKFVLPMGKLDPEAIAKKVQEEERKKALQTKGIVSNAKKAAKTGKVLYDAFRSPKKGEWEAVEQMINVHSDLKGVPRPSPGDIKQAKILHGALRSEAQNPVSAAISVARSGKKAVKNATSDRPINVKPSKGTVTIDNSRRKSLINLENVSLKKTGTGAAGLGIAAAGGYALGRGKYDPSKHPRAEDGKFRSKGILDTTLRASEALVPVARKAKKANKIAVETGIADPLGMREKGFEEEKVEKVTLIEALIPSPVIGAGTGALLGAAGGAVTAIKNSPNERRWENIKAGAKAGAKSGAKAGAIIAPASLIGAAGLPSSGSVHPSFLLANLAPAAIGAVSAKNKLSREGNFESLHPRDEDGKFRKKGFVQNVIREAKKEGPELLKQTKRELGKVARNPYTKTAAIGFGTGFAGSEIANRRQDKRRAKALDLEKE